MPISSDHNDESQQPVTVSVVIPARNEEVYLGSCLAAISAQDYTDFEVIVVDNGSTDRTAEVAAIHGARVVHEPEPGLPRAREAGRRAARGAYIVYIDADTHIPPNYLAEVVARFTREPRTVAVTSPVCFHDGSWSTIAYIWFYFFVYRILNSLRLIDFIFGGTFAIRAETLERIDGFNINIAFYGEDADLTKRVKRQGVIRYLAYLCSYTSARRYQREGLLTTFWHYTVSYFAVLLLNRPVSLPRWQPHVLRYGVLLSLMLSVLLYAFAYPESELFGKVIYRLHAPNKAVALTFDDAPSTSSTRAILRILAEEHVRATFFLTGEKVDGQPALAAEIVQAGHAIGNYSYSSSWSLSLHSQQAVIDEVRKADQAIYHATNQNSRLFRPPLGLRTPWMLSAIREEGYRVIMWDDMAEMPLGITTPDKLAGQIVRHVKPQSIIALHDSPSLRSGKSRQSSLSALRIIIRELKEQDYTFVTLDEAD